MVVKCHDYHCSRFYLRLGTLRLQLASLFWVHVLLVISTERASSFSLNIEKPVQKTMLLAPRHFESSLRRVRAIGRRRTAQSDGTGTGAGFGHYAPTDGSNMFKSRVPSQSREVEGKLALQILDVPPPRGISSGERGWRV